MFKKMKKKTFSNCTSLIGVKRVVGWGRIGKMLKLYFSNCTSLIGVKRNFIGVNNSILCKIACPLYNV
ncbi:hypothetical protein JHK82_044999 [Glycine max]|uniref:Uncharacterized protein n=2 Tax=Glycine subgen. Soja TaxID=1462606 RepID=A0A0R0G0C5_SOYBN|nr:hypothetical protein JHK86_045415 [Glycine max]KAG4941328.1 hypothetical protein JHK87_045199 [Glycine soja]KAG4952128.1 hypothetical protein JHK85_045995 [Glycine max]KAG5099947.1 hypothetical protein JHK82_044999 [Glycine max]KAH1151337.1 hypothetical protein GYH30_045034 [Glycine max]